MIKITELILNNTSKVIKFFVFYNRPYALYYNDNIILNDELTVSLSTTTISIKIKFTDDNSELTKVIELNTGVKTYNFNLRYGLENSKVAITKIHNIKKFFPSWSTIGNTNHSIGARIFNMIFSYLIESKITKIIKDIEANEISFFPIRKESIIKSNNIESYNIETYGSIFFNEIIDLKEEPFVNSLFSFHYSYGDSFIYSQNYIEKINGNNDCIFVSNKRFGLNNHISKTTNTISNSQLYPNFMFNNIGLRSSYSSNILTLNSNNDKISFYSPVEITKYIITNFGDLFFLDNNGFLYYEKLSTELIDSSKINPSINNNNIIELMSDYFTPTESLEVVVNILKAKEISNGDIFVKISNGISEYYLIDNDSFSLEKTPLNLSNKETIKGIIETEDTDKYILVECIIDNKDPYLAYSTSYRINGRKINNNYYSDMYIENERIILIRDNNKFFLTGKYNGTIKDLNNNYVSFKI